MSGAARARSLICSHPAAFEQRPIPLRHPIRFYEGHLASFNRGMLQQSGFLADDREPELTTLFARGIDPLDEAAAAKASIHQWPAREIVRGYVERVEEQMHDAFREAWSRSISTPQSSTRRCIRRR
jgi:hypothetical protein